ncbi:hypothetical protein [Pseudonocardia sp.]|jgi:hypothetical protein|uniref:hypothetical protein n=1 Tax=Pseudonocardia sp. TaxID=60912 RepID=UPI0029D38399|nr:hypothetical protein [Kribbellaceae bacterium]
MPSIGWDWLETLPAGRLRYAARLRAYVVQRIYLNGPAANLEFPDVDDFEHHIESTLLAAGLIDISEIGGVRRWSRRD